MTSVAARTSLWTVVHPTRNCFIIFRFLNRLLWLCHCHLWIQTKHWVWRLHLVVKYIRIRHKSKWIWLIHTKLGVLLLVLSSVVCKWRWRKMLRKKLILIELDKISLRHGVILKLKVWNCIVAVWIHLLAWNLTPAKLRVQVCTPWPLLQIGTFQLELWFKFNQGSDCRRRLGKEKFFSLLIKV